jgi:hypothetical protein
MVVIERLLIKSWQRTGWISGWRGQVLLSGFLIFVDWRATVQRNYLTVA